MTELIGVPHSDRALWAGWSRQIARFSRIQGALEPEIAAARSAYRNFHDYMERVISARRNNGDHSGDDMLSVLIRAEDEGDRLNDRELVGSMMMFTQASHETVANFVPNAMFHLLTKRRLFEQLRERPELIPAAVEEMLRIESPSANSLPRMAMEAIEIGGQTIPKGARIILMHAAANRDPTVFDDPEEIDFERPRLAKSVGFGGGAHICIGQHFARLEAAAILHEVVTRMPNLEMRRPAQFATGRLRGLSELIVKCHSAT